MKFRINFLNVLMIVALLAGAVFVSPARPVQAATTLLAGDLAIIGMNSDDPDEFAFVLLQDITSDTVIKFTDNGWLASGSFRTGEGFKIWTATTDLPAGTVITLTGTDVSPMLFSTSGDQILTYTGDDATPSFVYAINNEGAGVWQAAAVYHPQDTVLFWLPFGDAVDPAGQPHPRLVRAPGR